MSRTRAPAVDGLLLVDKPAGPTSHDVVSLARRATAERRIGHAGTLDPFATGLLVLLVGRATRLLPYMSGEPKVYVATVRFGAETTTDDLDGDTTVTAPPPERDAVVAAFPTLTGEIAQIPPAYSAKRVDGERAYAVARAGRAVVLAPSTVRVDHWELLAWRSGDVTDVTEADVRITCGGGTYIRALARDLGRLVGSAAHLTALRRVRSGPFDVADAATLDELGGGRAALLSPLAALPDYPRQPLAAADVARVARGIAVDASVDGTRAALLTTDGLSLVALAVRRGDVWQPRVVMHEA